MDVTPSALQVNGPWPLDKGERLRRAAEQMEALWLTQVLKEARPRSSLFESSFSGRLYKEMFDEILGEEMARSKAFGLAEALIRQIEPESISAGKELPPGQKKPMGLGEGRQAARGGNHG